MFFNICGSQGAEIFDNIFSEIMVKVSKNFSIKVIQQTSKKNVNNLKNFTTLMVLKIKFLLLIKTLLI